MDVFSHGLWGAIAAGRQNKKSFLTAFLVGTAPDVFSFGILFIAMILGLAPRPDWGAHPPASDAIPFYVQHLYNFTHSLVVFIGVFLLVWLFFRRPIWLLLPWGLHVLLDIFTHSFLFFPTPFLWPLSDYKFNGWSWGQPLVFSPNLFLLASVYFFWWRRKKRRARTA